MYFLPKSRSAWLVAVAFVAALVTATSCNSYNKSGNGYGVPTSPGTGLELNSGNLAPNATYTHRFASTGSFHYHCIYHSPMTGTVTVSANAADTLVTVTITSDTAPFPSATVAPGGTVRWINDNSMTHTITSN
ncbi:MAG: hypothetical protein ACM3JJ_05400 [Hyphomicrobiales bacterium]